MPLTARAFINDTGSTSSTNYIATSDIWYDWAATNAFQSSATTITIWNGWNSTSSGSAAVSSNVWYNWTEEAWQEYRESGQAPAQDNGTWEKLCAEQEAAKKKAVAILERHLTEEQRAQLARDRFFVVHGSKGRNYRINQGRARNVVELDAEGRPVARLCAHPGVACPDEDTMLAQKLMIETDEESFLLVANRSAA